MSLLHDGFTFGGHSHGTVLELQPFELPIVIGRFFGVRGESHIIGETQGRPLECMLTLKGFANIGLLATGKAAIHAKQGKLTGTLTETIGAGFRSFPKCTFLGFQPDEPPFLDGSGVHGWVQRGRLLWIERDR